MSNTSSKTPLDAAKEAEEAKAAAETIESTQSDSSNDTESTTEQNNESAQSEGTRESEPQVSPGQVPDDDDDDADTDDSDSSDVAKLLRKVRKSNAEAKKLRDRATAAEHALAQVTAAIAAGLPADMAARLQGTTAEELKADAEKLKEIIGGRSYIPGAPPRDAAAYGSDAGAENEPDLAKIGARIYRQG